MSGSLANSIGKQRLENAALEMSQDIEDYETFDDGIYYAIYTTDGHLQRGTFPKNFDISLTFQKVRLVRLKPVKVPSTTMMLRLRILTAGCEL